MFNPINNLTIIDTDFTNIRTDSIAVIQCISHDLTLINVNFAFTMNQNDESSIILFDSGDNNRKLIIKDVIFTLCIAFNNILSIKGQETKVELNRLVLNNNNIQRAIIEFESQYVTKYNNY